MSDRRHNIAALVAVQITRFVAGIAVSVVLARQLGVSSYGTYATIATVTHLLGFAANGGVHQLLPRSVARQPAEAHRGLLHSALHLTLLTGLFATALTGLWALWWRPSVLGAALVAGAALAAMSLVNVYMALFEGLRRMALQLRGVLAGRFVFVAATAGALWLNTGLVGVFAAQLLAWLVTLGFFAWEGRQNTPPSEARAPAWPLLRESLPFAGFVAFAAMQERIDLLLVEAWHDSSEAGLFRGATLFLVNVPVAARILTTAAYPQLAAAWHQHGAWQGSLRPILRLLATAGAGLSVGGAVLGPELLVDVLGEDYAASGPLLALGALMLLPLFVRTGLGTALIASDRERHRFAGIAFAALANITLCLLWVPEHGARGAIFATLLTECVLLALYAIPLRHELLASVGDLLLRTLPPALALGAAAWFIPQPWLAALGGTVVWAGVAWAVGAVKRSDLALLRSL